MADLFALLFVHRGLLWIGVMAHCFFEEPIGDYFIALCHQKKVDCFTLSYQRHYRDISKHLFL